MLARGKKKKKSPKTETIKVSKETYRRLVQTKGFYEMISGESLTMEDVIVALLDAVPKARASVEVIAEAEAGTEERSPAGEP